jgi:hypothetical protein
MIKAGINYKFESGLPAEAEVAERSKYSRDPSEDEDLQKASQNPIADLVSVPFQSNTNFNSGPFNRTQEILNIQPVVPMHLNADWNVISRTIIPLISSPIRCETAAPMALVTLPNRCVGHRCTRGS